MKRIVYITEILIKPRLGIYLQKTYYSDGTVEEKEVPIGRIIIPDILYPPF